MLVTSVGIYLYRSGFGYDFYPWAVVTDVHHDAYPVPTPANLPHYR
ncbi:hypothetical protein [Nocardia sp. BMG111209]|nr:hypothetical protein [Nocardia sp. BMG111209]